MAVAVSPGALAASTRVELDGLPVYECPPPPDEALIWGHPEVNAYPSIWRDDPSTLGYNLYLYSTSWVMDLDTNLLSPQVDSWSDMEAEYRLRYVRYFAFANPASVQGQTESAPGSWYGDPMYFRQSTSLQWDGERGGQEMYDGDFTEQWYAPAGLCMSVIRDDRVAGTAWFDPGEDTLFSDEMPGMVFYVFQIPYAESRITTGAMVGPLEHEYTSSTWGSPSSWIRTTGYFYTSYSSDLDPDELWSLPLLGDTGE
ncbi:hypothetical protein L6R53_32880 [Myxococcota bacterium]|nr:hypothetical protein [Myxococcota bacterium]